MVADSHALTNNGRSTGARVRASRSINVTACLVHQDTHIAYDELGRMSQLSDLRYRTTYRYDGAGNRARILSTHYDHAGVQLGARAPPQASLF